MPKKLLENAAAEKEANDVGMRYMNSNDVLKDMKRDYGNAVDGIKVHDDSIANAKVTAAGRDGIASGKDIYMREGSLSSHRPEVNGLLAHEVTHVMQQGNSASKSVEYGSEQGGILDFFKNMFKKKKEPELQISEPTLVSHSSYSQYTEQDKAFAEEYARRFADVSQNEEQYLSETGIRRAKQEASTSSMAPEDVEAIKRYQLPGTNASTNILDFTDIGGMILHQMALENPGQLAQSGLARAAVTSSYNHGMMERLHTVSGKDLVAQRNIFRGNGVGELNTLNMVTRAMLPEGYSDSLIAKDDEPFSEAETRELNELGPDMRDKALDRKKTDRALNQIVSDIGEGGPLAEVGEMLADTRGAFSGSDYFDSDEEASAMMMNNLILRAIGGDINVRAAKIREQGVKYSGKGMSQKEEITDQSKVDLAKKYSGRSVGIMKALAAPFANDQQRKSNGILQALRRRMSRRTV